VLGDTRECGFDVVAGEMPAIGWSTALQLAHHVIAELDVVLGSNAFVVVVIEEESTGELCRTAASVAPFESRQALSYEIEASIGGESLVFGEVEYDRSVVDVHPHILDVVSVRLARVARSLYVCSGIVGRIRLHVSNAGRRIPRTPPWG
jgi:hypothetical protein